MSGRRAAALGIRAKLFLVFLTLVLAPFAVYTGITYYQSARNAERAGRFAARQVLVQAGQFISARVGLVRRALQFIALDPEVRRACVADPAIYRRDLGQWVAEAARVRRVLLAVGQNAPGVSGITLYMDGGLAAYSEAWDLQSLDRQRGAAWYRRAAAGERQILWYGPTAFPAGDEAPRFHGVARVPDDLDLTKTAGWVRVDVPVRALSDILDQTAFSASSAAFLIDPDGVPIAFSRRAAGPDRELLGPASAAFPPEPAGDEGARMLAVGGRRYLADCLYVADTGWRLLLVVPYEDIDAFGKGVRRDMLIALVVIVPLLLPLAYWLASTSTRRIARLAAGVRQFERGNLSLRVAGEEGDEIGELGRDLDRMAARIGALLEERYRLGQETKHQEMRALQAQINPHFLYNTLDLVNCLSLREGVPTIGAAVEALSRFYRLSLSGGAEMVTVGQELEHVETYVRIQNMRFDDGIALVLEVPPEVRALPMLKIVLQPLVENAVLHGIRERESGRGTVTVRGAVRGEGGGAGVLVLEVEDDGVGMDEERLLGLRTARRSDDHGYGVRNIDRRLKVEYGDGYGLDFRSDPGRGTIVTVRLPARPEAGMPTPS